MINYVSHHHKKSALKKKKTHNRMEWRKIIPTFQKVLLGIGNVDK